MATGALSPFIINAVEDILEGRRLAFPVVTFGPHTIYSSFSPTEEQIAQRRAKNKRRAASRFRARERNRLVAAGYFTAGEALQIDLEYVYGWNHENLTADKLRRQTGATALASTVLPAPAAELASVSPEPGADFYLGMTEHEWLDIARAHNINKEGPDIMAAIRDSARSG
jgi:hypothetical protein